MSAKRKQSAPQVSERACDVCGARGPGTGPLPWSWDQHIVIARVAIDHDRKTLTEMSEMVSSCSPECRAKRGWVERKGRGGHV